MTAAQIIEEIKHLPSGERSEVESFIRNDDAAARLTPAELGDLAKQLAECADPTQADQLENQIVAGFYGKA